MSADGNPLIGWDPLVENLFQVNGFTAGIGAGAGVGDLVAQWVLSGRDRPAPVHDAIEEEELLLLDPGRFGASPLETPSLQDAAINVFGTYYHLKSDSGANKAN